MHLSELCRSPESNYKYAKGDSFDLPSNQEELWRIRVISSTKIDLSSDIKMSTGDELMIQLTKKTQQVYQLMHKKSYQFSNSYELNEVTSLCKFYEIRLTRPPNKIDLQICHKKIWVGWRFIKPRNVVEEHMEDEDFEEEKKCLTSWKKIAKPVLRMLFHQTFVIQHPEHSFYIRWLWVVFSTLHLN